MSSNCLWRWLLCFVSSVQRSGERTSCRLLWSTIRYRRYSQVSISLVIQGLWWTVSGQVKAHVVLTCTNGVSLNHLLVIVASDRPWTTLSTRAHLRNLKADWTYSTKRMMTQSYDWNLQRLQHSRNNETDWHVESKFYGYIYITISPISVGGPFRAALRHAMHFRFYGRRHVYTWSEIGDAKKAYPQTGLPGQLA